MKARLTLPRKIFFLAFLNFLLVALAAVIFASIEFRFELNSLLMIPAQERIMAAREELASELEQSPAQRRNEILERYSSAYGVRFLLVDNRGNQVGGPATPLPNEVRERILQPPGLPGRPGGPGPRPHRPPPEDDIEGPRLQAAGRPGPPTPPVFLVATRHPRRYWVGERMRIASVDDPEPIPGVLLLLSPSLWGNRFFFDIRPWLMLVAAAIGLSLACWLPFLRGLAQSIRGMSEATARLAEGRFEIHLSEVRRDELGQLSASINRVAGQLHGFVQGQKRFLSDIAHELCAPIARLQFALGILEQRRGAERDRHIAVIEDEVQHMSSLVNELLSFSKAGLQGDALKPIRVEVAEIVDRVLVREKPDRIEVRLDEGIAVLADPDCLFRSLSNLVRNAIRYAGEAGPISIEAHRQNGTVQITVADRGPGLPAETLEDIFKPFYRPERARTRESGGAGLGLAIVKTCVEACKGTVVARNREPSGLEVEMRLAAA